MPDINESIVHLVFEYDNGEGDITEFQKYFNKNYADSEFEALLFEVVNALRGCGYGDALIKKYIDLDFQVSCMACGDKFELVLDDEGNKVWVLD